MEFNDIKKGAVIIFENKPHEIMWSNFMRMQQRKPVMQVKMRNLMTGKVVEYSFKSGERVEGADISKQKVQFLYADREGAHFMTADTYETVILSKDISADKIGYLTEGLEITLEYFEGKPINLGLPIKMDLKVISTPPGIKGDTATSGTKPATLETGLVINVPLFIKEGDVVRVNTETGEYTERVS